MRGRFGNCSPESSLSDTIKSATQGRGSSVSKVSVADQVREYAYIRHILPGRYTKLFDFLARYRGSAMPCWHASLKPSIKSVSFPPAAQYKVPQQLLHSRFDCGLAINATLGHYQPIEFLDHTTFTC